MQEDVQALLQKYKQKLTEQLNIPTQPLLKPVWSREYQQFKHEYLPKHLSLYEKLCSFAGNLLKIKADKKKAPLVQEVIDICHLDITPSGVTSLAILAPIIVIVFGSICSYALFKSIFFIMFFFIAGIALFPALNQMPFFFANSWRMKASNQMVLCIFYIVTYMRHTSNLELAIKFAAEHLEPPLALDLKKVLWDVETGRYESVKESLDFYLETWRKWNMEFIESFHLIESSLYEPTEERRLDLLDKALDVILSETYEKMLHYAHNLKNPITMLHMLGIILPILGLVILPLVVNFLGEVQWYHLALLYDVALPIAVYFLGVSILSKRPTGYGDTDIAESNPELKKYRNAIINIAGLEIKINPLTISIVVFAIFMFIGLIPLIIHASNPDFDISIFGGKFRLLEYRESATVPGKRIGPFGLGSSMLSLAVTLAVGISIGLYFKLRSKNVIKIRNSAKELEKEFASALFQLGNRLGDGLPAEIAFGKVADVMTGTTSGSFFQLVGSNISHLGMSVKEAIFNPHTGALVYFPSRVIESSMKVLIESMKKGPKIAAQALMNVARYIKEIHRVDERLKDLLSEIIASMKSQISFLTPAIAGIVIGITSMVTAILGRLGEQMATLSAGGEATPIGIGLLEMFGTGIPTFYFQIIVGIYVVQITYILIVLANGIENGADKLAERYFLGTSLTKATVLYVVISLIVMLLFNFVAIQVMQVTLT